MTKTLTRRRASAGPSLFAIIAAFGCLNVGWLLRTQNGGVRRRGGGGGRSRSALADGCYHIFVDGGANIGVHGRFLLEPGKYPDANEAGDVFDGEFGPPADRDNRDFCVFEFGMLNLVCTRI